MPALAWTDSTLYRIMVTRITSPRIVSLLPSATEIVAALGFGDHFVGRSHECDFPPGVERLCSSTKVPPDGTSYEIDERVKEIVAEGLSVYRVDADRLRELRSSPGSRSFANRKPDPIALFSVFEGLGNHYLLKGAEISVNFGGP